MLMSGVIGFTQQFDLNWKLWALCDMFFRGIGGGGKKITPVEKHKLFPQLKIFQKEIKKSPQSFMDQLGQLEVPNDNQSER